MQLNQCPDRDVWRRFLLGELRGTDAHDLETHLEACPRCQESLADANADDELVAALRRPSHVLSGGVADTSPDENATPDAAASSASQATPSAACAGDETDEREQFAGYRVVRRLGKGASGVVYLAQDERLGRLIALKILQDVRRDDGGYLARFEREARILAQLQHPGIVKIHEVGWHRGRAYLALEYIDGGSLADRIAVQLLPVREASRLVRELALAVEFAHQHGVIHRDLKPGNILVGQASHGSKTSTHLAGTRGDSREGVGEAIEHWETKIADFGLGRQCDDAGLTRTGDFLGTPGYMAPEALTGNASDRISPAVDIYSLGAIYYELLTARVPFRGESPLETLDQARNLDPVPPRRLRPGVPRDAQTICLKCLEKDPARRYASAAALAADLGRFLSGAPILARPLNPAARVWKWGRRRPAVASLLLATGVCLAALVAGAIVYESRLRGALAEARRASERADQNYRGARTALRQMLAHTSNPRWNDAPQLQQLRREQAAEALRYFDSIARQADSDPAVRQDVAWTCTEAAKLLILLGRQDEARVLLERGMAAYDALPRKTRNTAEARRIHANMLLTWGGFIDDDSQLQIRRQELGVAELEELLQREPSSNETKDSLGNALITLGGSQIKYAAFEPAAKSLERAVALLNERAAAAPNEPGPAVASARARINLAAAYRQLGRLAEARREHAQAESALEAALAHDPHDRDTVEGLAALRVNGAGDLEADEKYGEAAEYVLRNAPMLEAALVREPNDAIIRDRLFRTYGVTALMYDKAGRQLDAAAAWERMLPFNPPESRLEHHLQFVALLANAAQPARALAAAEQARALLSKNPSAASWTRLADSLDQSALWAEGELAERCRAAADDARRQAGGGE